MSWKYEFSESAKKDLSKIDNSSKAVILKGIKKVAQNPLPKPAGYGVPLGNRQNSKLANCCKIKFKAIGYRVVYKLELSEEKMRIIIISIRDDNTVYKEAEKRLHK